MEKSKTFIILCLFGILGLLCGGCSKSKSGSEKSSEQVIVANADFETGAIAPWSLYQYVTAYVSSGKAHGGKFSLAEARGSGTVYQDVKGLHAGTEYTFSAWVYGEAGTTARAQLAVYEPGAKAATSSEEITPVNGWQRLTHRVRLGSGDLLRVHLSRYDGNGTIYWDDVEVSPSK